MLNAGGTGEAGRWSEEKPTIPLIAMPMAPLPAQNALTKPYEFCPRMARLSTELRCRQVPILAANAACTQCNCLRNPGPGGCSWKPLWACHLARLTATRRLMPFGRLSWNQLVKCAAIFHRLGSFANFSSARGELRRSKAKPQGAEAQEPASLVARLSRALPERQILPGLPRSGPWSRFCRSRACRPVPQMESATCPSPLL